MTTKTTEQTAEIERKEWDARAETEEGALHEALSTHNETRSWVASIVRMLNEIIPRLTPTMERPKYGSRLRYFDLGCGIGRLSSSFNRLVGGEMVGFDISKNTLAHADSRTFTEDREYIEYCHCDGRTIPWTDDGFSGGFSVNMFQHIPDDAVQEYLKEVCRVLKPGGIFVFQFVTGTERAPFMYQRSFENMAGWCKDAGFYNWHITQDPIQREWQWTAAKK